MEPNTIKAIQSMSTMLGAVGQFRAGNAYEEQGVAIQNAKEFQAQQLRARATSKRASGQAAARIEKKKLDAIQSKLTAKAAMQGGATDPSVVTLAENIEAEGTLRGLTAMFEGEEAARSDEAAAIGASYEGTIAKDAGKQKRDQARAASYVTLLGLAGKQGTLFDKYGEDDWAPAGSGSDQYDYFS